MLEENVAQQFDLDRNFVKSLERWLIYFLGISILGIVFICVELFLPPLGFNKEVKFTISSGENVRTISAHLYEQNIIRSPFLFKVFVVFFGGEKKIVVADYLLSPKGLVSVAYDISRGEFGVTKVKVTIPEGTTSTEIANILSKKIPNFDTVSFIAEARPLEGYLFPDTYFIPLNASTSNIVDQMHQNYLSKISPLLLQLQSQKIPFLSTEKDLVTLASIVENEARTPESRKMVAGILLKRLKIAMPLQVDSSFVYINGKNSKTLTGSDLRSDSPYNTYTRTGLPPTPIGNPGEEAILDVINYTPSDFVYFLTGDNGKMYYAKTFEEHKVNKQKYLK